MCNYINTEYWPEYFFNKKNADASKTIKMAKQTKNDKKGRNKQKI